MPEHGPDLHIIDDMDHFQRSTLCAISAPAARMHVERCECGAVTVRPYEPELLALMRSGRGVACEVDERARAYVLSVAYDPAERNDLADGEVWAEETVA